MKGKSFPEPTVGALIINSKGSVLLVESSKWGGKLSIPGGHVEVGETIGQALKREVKEEVGIDIEVLGLLMIQDAINPRNYHKPGKHFIFMDFLAEAKSENIRVDRREIQDFMWVKPEKALKRRDVEGFTRKLVRKYIAWRKI
jgi:nucleoside triphosphatase